MVKWGILPLEAAESIDCREAGVLALDESGELCAHLEFHHWYPWHDIGALAFGSVYPRTIQEKCSANGRRANMKNRLDWPSFSPVNMKSLERLHWYAHSCILTDSRQTFRSDLLRYIWYFLASNLSLFPTLLLLSCFSLSNIASYQ